jgi:antitoxin component of MazEF toxin-antitoxin module
MKLKLRKIGNSVGVILPKKVVKCYNIGEEIEVNVITKEDKPQNVITKETHSLDNVITKPKWWCHKHKQWNTVCGC